MKAILVIDMPNDCYDCPCYDHEGGICQAVSNWKTDRENCCPLRPLPQKKAINTNDLLANAEAFGWNNCLREIE